MADIHEIRPRSPIYSPLPTRKIDERRQGNQDQKHKRKKAQTDDNKPSDPKHIDEYV